MVAPMDLDRGPVFDILGVGFGPANLAIAIALAERNIKPDQVQIRACFVESYPHFAWHPAMMLPGSRMQISYAVPLFDHWFGSAEFC